MWQNEEENTDNINHLKNTAKNILWMKKLLSQFRRELSVQKSK